MAPLTLSVVLALVTPLCLAAYDPFLDMDTGDVKKMLADQNDVREKVAGSMLQEDFRKFQNEAIRPPASVPIPDAAQRLGLDTLVKDINKTHLRKPLSAKGPFTLFGPTNEAFKHLPDWAKNNTAMLTDVLKFHVLSGVVKSSDLKNELLATTLQGKKLRINIYKKKDSVVNTAQCAPINLNRVDQPAKNGVIHVLDAAMIPPRGNAAFYLATYPRFSILTKAVKVAGLVETLSGNGPFTIFAPTDAAFAKLPPGTLEKLLKNPQILAKILKYHVVSATFCSAGLSSGSVKTVEGQTVDVKVSANGVTVNNAKVTSPDGSITNGVVHVIDTVLLPPNFFLW